MDSRQRMIETTIRLLRTQGLRATGINQIVQGSKAPRGSIYFHFPGGKEQLAIEAVRIAGANGTRKIRDALDGHKDTATALRRYIEVYAEEIRESDFQRGCPIANIATDAAATSPPIRTVCAEIFAEWQGHIAKRLERDGFRKRKAEALAELILSSIEGAIIFCRARRSTEPLARVAEHLTATLAKERRARS
jgi:AcrR family transcriptional regulator